MQGVKPNSLDKLLPRFRQVLTETGHKSVRGLAVRLIEDEKVKDMDIPSLKSKLYQVMTGQKEPSVTTAAWLSDILPITLSEIAKAFDEVKVNRGFPKRTQGCTLSSCSEETNDQILNIH